MPATKYALSGDINIAYQVIGQGPRDLVYVPGWVSNIEVMWEDPGLARFLNRLASFSRLIVFDKRGTGLSDPVEVEALPSLEVRMDDLRAVMDAAGSERATLLGHSEGGNMCVLFAATYPERTEGLALMGCYVKRIRSDDYPWAPTLEARLADTDDIRRNWIDPAKIAEYYAPSRASDPSFRTWVERYLRLSASPRAAAALNMMNTYIDVTSILPAIRVPTLLIYRLNDPDVMVEEGRYIASLIPHAKLVELPGSDHFFWAGDSEPILEEIEEFVTGRRAGAAPERSLPPSSLPTSSTRQLGPQRWAIWPGGTFSLATTQWWKNKPTVGGDGWSRRPGMGCWPPLTDRPAPFEPAWAWSVAPPSWDSRSGSESTPARPRSLAPMWAGSPFISGPELPLRPEPAMYWCREPSKTWWRGQVSI